MNGFTVRQFGTLLLSVSTVVVGYLGLTGRITDTTPVIVAGVIAISLVSFSLGRQSAQLEYTEPPWSNDQD